MATEAGVAPRGGGREPDVRVRLLAAAARLFADHGYAGASVREICEAVGVTKPTLYYYFGSKGGLAQALFDEAANNILGMLKTAAISDEPLQGKLRTIARAIFRLSADSPDVCRFFFASVFAPPSAGPDYDFNAVIPLVIAETGKIIAGYLPEGESRLRDADRLAMIFLGALQGYEIRFMRRQDVALTPDLADRIVDTFIKGAGAWLTNEETTE